MMSSPLDLTQVQELHRLTDSINTHFIPAYVWNVSQHTNYFIPDWATEQQEQTERTDGSAWH